MINPLERSGYNMCHSNSQQLLIFPHGCFYVLYDSENIQRLFPNHHYEDIEYGGKVRRKETTRKSKT
jgi:hypothetical protein